MDTPKSDRPRRQRPSRMQPPGAEASAVARNLYAFLISRGITRNKAAEKSGISKTLLTNFFNGRAKTLHHETLVKLAGAFGVSIDVLTGGGQNSEETQGMGDDLSTRQLLKALLDGQAQAAEEAARHRALLERIASKLGAEAPAETPVEDKPRRPAGASRRPS